jgi:RNA polymerase sigma-70 factor (ECF subfamily)
MTGIDGPATAAEAAMLDAARHGDLLAWERLVRQYEEAAFRVAYLVVRESELAEAATQSTFVRAYRALPNYEEDIGLLPWLIRIAASEARQQRREAGRPTPSSRPVERATGPHVPATPAPAMAMAANMTPLERQTITEAFERLGEEDRLIIAARYLFGLSATDTADALSIASGLVRDHLTTALRRLRQRMAAA